MRKVRAWMVFDKKGKPAISMSGCFLVYTKKGLENRTFIENQVCEVQITALPKKAKGRK